MPKLQKSEMDEKAAILLGIIRKYQQVRDLTNIKLAERMGMAITTLYGKFQNPTRFTWEELYMIFKILKVPPDEVVECFPGKAKDLTVKVILTDRGGKIAGVYQ